VLRSIVRFLPVGRSAAASAPATGGRKNALRRIGAAIGVGIISIVVGFALVEVGYRLVLLRKDPRVVLPWRAANPKSLPPIQVYNRSLWKFDPDEGYQYVRENVDLTRIEQGIVTDCRRLNPINSLGGSGLIEGDYASAEVKIAVFGDSFTWFSSPENLTWTNYLQRDLQRATGRSVHVLNFARDGVGVMRLFELAADRLPKYRPDFVVFALTTNAGMRGGRIWRFETLVNGEPRVFTTGTPNQTADPSVAYDTFLLHPRATLQWCQSVKGRSDEVTREIIDKYVRLRVKRYSAFDLSRSFLLNQIVNKDPFASSRAIDRILPDVPYRPFSNDETFVQAVSAVEKTGIPYLLIHVPTYGEVGERKEFLPDVPVERADLEEVTSHPVIRLLGHLDLPGQAAERMFPPLADFHPSAFGMQITATGVLRVLLREGFVSAKP
jgi:hypothetical protein